MCSSEVKRQAKSLLTKALLAEAGAKDVLAEGIFE
jgi:hypothetical protein